MIVYVKGTMHDTYSLLYQMKGTFAEMQTCKKWPQMAQVTGNAPQNSESESGHQPGRGVEEVSV